MSTTVRAKDPDTPATYQIDVFEALVPEALRSHEFDVGDVVRAQRDTGFLYRCAIAGRTARAFPIWARQAGELVRDGSIDWNTVRPEDANAPIILSVIWTPPSGLTLDSQEEEDHIARATFSGGTDGQDYDVTARITPTVGQPIDHTITIPVRSQ